MNTYANDWVFSEAVGNAQNPPLTKREYFAVMAMQGMLANQAFFQLMVEKLPPQQHAEFLNKAAVEQADSLIAELNKGEVPGV